MKFTISLRSGRERIRRTKSIRTNREFDPFLYYPSKRVRRRGVFSQIVQINSVAKLTFTFLQYRDVVLKFHPPIPTQTSIHPPHAASVRNNRALSNLFFAIMLSIRFSRIDRIKLFDAGRANINFRLLPFNAPFEGL